MFTRLSGVLSVVAALVFALAAPATAAVINGTSGPDTLVGTPNADVIRGFEGNDTLYGKPGADVIYGGYGHDAIHPGYGADVVYGGYGNDVIRAAVDTRQDMLYGGPGSDRIVMSFFDHAYAGPGNDTIVVRGDGADVSCGPGYDRVIIYPSMGHTHDCEVFINAVPMEP